MILSRFLTVLALAEGLGAARTQSPGLAQCQGLLIAVVMSFYFVLCTRSACFAFVTRHCV